MPILKGLENHQNNIDGYFFLIRWYPSLVHTNHYDDSLDFLIRDLKPPFEYLANLEKLLKPGLSFLDIILFLTQNKTPQSISILQNKVWGYTFDLETHTVETHIYRLRKKIKDRFDDDKFIISHDEGYLV